MSSFTPALSRILTVALIALLVILQLFYTNMLREFRSSMDMHFHGVAYRPFAYRVLVPSIVRVLDNLTPTSLSSHLDYLAAKVQAWTGAVTGVANENPRAVLWLGLVQVIALIGYVRAGTLLLSNLYPNTKIGPWIGPLLLIILLPFLGQKLGHIYDFTLLLLMMTLLLLMWLEFRMWYLLVFALACLNKETTVLVLAAYAAVNWERIPARQLIIDLSLQILIFVCTHGAIRWIFRDNSGSGVEFWLFAQFAYYRDHSLRLLALIALGVWLTMRLPNCPTFLRRATVAMIVPQTGLILLGASPGEVRNLYEIVPVVSMVALGDLELLLRRIKRFI